MVYRSAIVSRCQFYPKRHLIEQIANLDGPNFSNNRHVTRTCNQRGCLDGRLLHRCAAFGCFRQTCILTDPNCADYNIQISSAALLMLPIFWLTTYKLRLSPSLIPRFPLRVIFLVIATFFLCQQHQSCLLQTLWPSFL